MWFCFPPALWMSKSLLLSCCTSDALLWNRMGELNSRNVLRTMAFYWSILYCTSTTTPMLTIGQHVQIIFKYINPHLFLRSGWPPDFSLNVIMVPSLKWVFYTINRTCWWKIHIFLLWTQMVQGKDLKVHVNSLYLQNPLCQRTLGNST